MRISDKVIQDIRQRVDIVQLISRSIALKQRGRNHIGLCPFHNEKTPSFNVNPERGSYYCFGCHASGDAISFVQHTEAKTFPEAVRELAKSVGILIEEQPETPEQRSRREQGERLAEVNAVLLEHYRQQLASPAGREARRYLEGRGVPAAELERFAVGFAGGRTLPLAGALAALNVAELVAAGALIERQPSPYHRFADRVMFPIRDLRGRVLGFGARVFGRQDDGHTAKYINSPETPLFHKSDVLYGMFEARGQLGPDATAILVEGYLDVISLHAAELRTAVAPCGTALTRPQVRLLAKRCKRVVLLFDGDQAGIQAARRALPLLLEQGLEVRLGELPEGEDPDSLARSAPEHLRALVADAPSALEVAIERASRRGAASVEGRLNAVEELREPLNALPEGLSRDLYHQRAAEALRVDLGALRRELRRSSGGAARAPAAEPAAVAAHVPMKERQVARIFVEQPALFNAPLARHLPDLVQSPAIKAFFEGGLQAASGDGAPPPMGFVRDLVAQHPVLAEMQAEIDADRRLYDAASAGAALEEVCESLWRARARLELEQMTQALAQTRDDNEQLELLGQIKALNTQLDSGCPWLDQAKGDRPRRVGFEL